LSKTSFSLFLPFYPKVFFFVFWGQTFSELKILEKTSSNAPRIKISLLENGSTVEDRSNFLGAMRDTKKKKKHIYVKLIASSLHTESKIYIII